MKKEKILYLEKMGCDFFIGDDINTISDLNNYRYYIHDIILKDDINSNLVKNNKNKKLDTLEISRGARYEKDFRLKDDNGCWFNTYYYDDNNSCYGLLEINKKLNKGNYNGNSLYNKDTILNMVNSISKIQYDTIEYIERY